MKLFGAFVCLSLAAVSLSADRDTVLAGQPGLTSGQIGSLVRGLGSVKFEDANGMYRIQPTVGVSIVQLSQKLSGKVAYVLPGTADGVDTEDIASVDDHIAYINAGFTIRHGRQPARNENTGAEYYESLRYTLSSRVGQNGRIDRGAYMAGAGHRADMPGASRAIMDPGVPNVAMAPVAWAFVGPKALSPPYEQLFGLTTLSGRKNSIVVAPSNPSVMYTDTANGGVWKTTNGGTTWTPLSDKWSFLNVTGLAVDPTDANIVYAGTGDYYGLRQTSFGIMKSTDGGATWTNYGAAQFGDSTVTRIALVPGSPNIVLALTAGTHGDIWRSTDGGQTWTSTNAPDADWQDIDVRTNGTFIAVSATTGIYRSTGNGSSWVPVNAPATAGGSLWDIAASKTDVNRFYLATSNHHVYRSINGGSLWTDITAFHDAGANDPAANWAASTFDLFVETAPGVSQEGFDVIYVGLRTLSISDDSGLNWQDVSESLDPTATWHAGQHCFAVNPTDPTKGYIGGDGGVAAVTYTDASNSATFTGLNDTLGDTEFYTVAVHPTSTTQVMGGAQSNATPASRGNLTAWRSLFDGDGGAVAFDLTTPNTHYTGSSFGGVYRYTSPADFTADDISPGGGLFTAPLICAGPTGSIPTYGAANGMVRTYESNVWNDHATGAAAIRALTSPKANTDRVYAGADNGDIYRASSLSGSFAKIDSTLPNRAIGGMAESPFTPNLLLVGLQGTGFADGVYRSPNTTLGSPTWTNVSGVGVTGLPAMPVNDVDFDPFTNVYYAATDVGVFLSPDGGARWYNMNVMGFPNVPVRDLWVYSNGGTNFLYAATYGRGIWRCLLSQRFLTAVQIAKPAIYGGQQNTVTLKMNGSAPAGAAALVSDDSPNVSVTPVVNFPLGSTQVTFTIFSTDPASNQTVTISAKVYGTTTTNSFTLHHVPNFTYTPGSANVYGGDTFTATVNLGVPAPITTIVTFSDNSAAVSSPTSTSIAAGSQVKTVTLHTATVGTPTNVTISAKIANTTHSGSVTIQPRPDLAALAIVPPTVQGGSSATGTVTMTAIGGAGSQTCALSDTSSVVTTPGSVAVPGGALTADFNVGTSAVTATYNVTVRATLRGVSKTATITVHP